MLGGWRIRVSSAGVRATFVVSPLVSGQQAQSLYVIDDRRLHSIPVEQSERHGAAARPLYLGFKFISANRLPRRSFVELIDTNESIAPRSGLRQTAE